MNIKVLNFYKAYIPESFGGIERSIYELSTHLPEYEIDVRVLSLSNKNIEKKVHLENHTAYIAKRSFSIASTCFSISLIKTFKELANWADVIHYHYPWPFMDLVHFCARTNKPTVLTYHSDIVRQRRLMALYRPLMNAFMRDMTRIVATSPNYMLTSNVLQNYKNKVEIIPLGVDKASYPSVGRGVVDRLEKTYGKAFFIFVGVLRYYKGLEILLDALAIRQFPVLIVGSGPMESKLKSRAEALGLGCIIFLGHISDQEKIALIGLSRAMVFPSNLRSEAFGVSLLEAAMCGKPLISCEIGTGTSFVNEHNITGLVVTPGDKFSLADAMSTLWDNPVRAHQMGREAERRYHKYFTADQMAKSYAELYKRLVA